MTFNHNESGASVRAKLNTALQKLSGNAPITNNLVLSGGNIVDNQGNLLTGGKIYQAVSGRVRVDQLNEWHGFSSPVYGWMSENQTNSYGTGSSPVGEWQDMGVLIPPGKTFKSMKVQARASHTSFSEYELCVQMVEYAPARNISGTDADNEITVTELHKDLWKNPSVGTALTGEIQDFHYREFAFNQTSVTTAPTQIRVAWRPTIGSPASNRYIYHNTLFEFE